MTGGRHAELSGIGGNHHKTFLVADCAGYAAAIEEEMRVLEEIHALMGGMATDCYYPDIHLLKQSGKRTGDQITVIGKSRQSDGLGAATLPCSLNLYYFSGPENKGWHRLEQFEEWVLPYLKALFVVENGHQILAPQQVNTEVFDAFQLIYSWQNKGISSNFKQIPFSAKLKQKIIDHLWAKSWSGQIRPLNVELDIALFLEKPFFQLTQSLAKLGQTVAVDTQKGTPTAVLYYMLNTGQKQAIAKISRRGAMIELEYLTAKNATTTEVVFELQNVTYLSPNKTEKIGNLQYIRNAGKYGWREVSGTGDELTTLLLKSGEDFTVLANARKLPGVSTGAGKNISGAWLRGTERNAGLFPKSVADKLRGQTFNNFDEFRQAFWKEVANDPNLTSQFKPQNVSRMQSGLAPIAVEEQWLGAQKSYVLHHKTPINQGGAVYDVDNLYIVTPKYHKEILDPAYHYGYGY